uniref:putative transferase CAF17, mitochondrial n=1 Tax=Myxine glutinosa TaxID=7769 RepID=UPI00358FDFE7
MFCFCFTTFGRGLLRGLRTDRPSTSSFKGFGITMSPASARRASCRGLHCYRLTHRSVLRAQGPDTETFLNGILTNDLGPLFADEETRPRDRAIYSHCLNVQGRVLFDVIVYRLQADEPVVLIECDTGMAQSLHQHLCTYRLRRRISLTAPNEGQKLSVWAVVPPPLQTERLSLDVPVLTCTNDPRTEYLGLRLIVNADVPVTKLLVGSTERPLLQYEKLRYQLGVPEGPKDLPSGVALPLESNLTQLNGVSFSKGCYLGQELTARTHHTGVIRKCLLPVTLDPSPPDEAVLDGTEVLSEDGRRAGRLRAHVGSLGLALLRLSQVHRGLRLQAHSNFPAFSLSAQQPPWWPKHQQLFSDEAGQNK